MEVLDPQQTVLTNAELYNIISERKKSLAGLSREAHGCPSLRTITYETFSYLSESPAASQTEEQVRSFIKAIAAYKLTAAEILQLINLRSTSAVEVQLVVEECEERFTEEQVNEIFAIVKQCFCTENKEKEEGKNISS